LSISDCDHQCNAYLSAILHVSVGGYSIEIATCSDVTHQKFPSISHHASLVVRQNEYGPVVDTLSMTVVATEASQGVAVDASGQKLVLQKQLDSLRHDN